MKVEVLESEGGASEAPNCPRWLSPTAGSIPRPRPGQALQAAGPVALVEQVVCHLLQVLQVCLHEHPSQVQKIAVMWVLHWGADPRTSGNLDRVGCPKDPSLGS